MDAPGEAARERGDGGGAPADRLGQREPGSQVDDVVLPEVDERDAERAGVRPPEQAGQAARLGEEAGGGHGGGGGQRGHGGQGVAPEPTGKGLPAGTPEL